jgi:hypothetical protein
VALPQEVNASDQGFSDTRGAAPSLRMTVRLDPVIALDEGECAGPVTNIWRRALSNEIPIPSTATHLPMRTIRILALLAALVTTAGCSGMDDLLPEIAAPSVDVAGEWVLMYPANDGAHTETRMKFGADGSYRSELLWIGFYGLPAGEVTGYMRTRGQYRLEGDRLMLRIVFAEEWQKYAVGPNPSVSTPRPVWGERGTLAVDGDRLLHTYVSAPADAPQTFTEVYRRER